MVGRVPWWDVRLDAVIEAARHTPYQIGSSDCFRLTCAVVEALTGIDRWPEFTGRYSSRGEACALLARHGSTFESAFDSFFGAGTRIAPCFARRGDIAALRTADGEKHLGVMLGHALALYAPEGLLFVAPDEARCAWRVG